MPRFFSFLFNTIGFLAGVVFIVLIMLAALFLAGAAIIGLRESGVSVPWAKVGGGVVLVSVVLAAMTISDMVRDIITWWTRRDIKNLEGDE